MFSKLKPNRIYTDLSPEVTEHDEDIEADEWNYDGRNVYRGIPDPKYSDIKVYSLYDDTTRVGLVEEIDNDFEVLWFHNNPFATLFQNTEWKATQKTIWSTMSNEAYQDCLEDDFKTVFDKMLKSNTRLITPNMIINKPNYYECQVCKKVSFTEMKKCLDVVTHPFFDNLSNFKLLFIDDLFVIHEPPADLDLTFLMQSSSCEEHPEEQSSAETAREELQVELPLPSPQPEQSETQESPPHPE